MVILMLCMMKKKDYCPDQDSIGASIDHVHNSHGITLLELWKSTGLRIINGRRDDSCKYTFYSYNGCFVIDYALISDQSFSSITDFKVCDFNEWSDHARLHFHYVVITSPMHEIYAEVRYK
jgi:hypothetical protein